MDNLQGAGSVVSVGVRPETRLDLRGYSRQTGKKIYVIIKEALELWAQAQQLKEGTEVVYHENL